MNEDMKFKVLQSSSPPRIKLPKLDNFQSDFHSIVLTGLPHVTVKKQ